VGYYICGYSVNLIPQYPALDRRVDMGQSLHKKTCDCWIRLDYRLCHVLLKGLAGIARRPGELSASSRMQVSGVLYLHTKRCDGLHTANLGDKPCIHKTLSTTMQLHRS
jgi:hypothetical protein